jgi:hypothetical protein
MDSSKSISEQRNMELGIGSRIEHPRFGEGILAAVTPT